MAKMTNKNITTDHITRRQFTAGLSSTAVAAVILPARQAAAKTILTPEHALAPRIMGDENATITVTEYFSMTCGHCGNFHRRTFPEVKSELIDTGKIKFELKAFPLNGVALRAHALVRALPIDAYFPMVDILLDEQKTWVGATDQIAALKTYARQAGISGSAFDEIMENRPFLEAVYSMQQTANERFKVESTPSFVVNETHKFSGAVSFKEFVKQLENFSV